jgi:hypothetical protein
MGYEAQCKIFGGGGVANIITKTGKKLATLYKPTRMRRTSKPVQEVFSL